MRKANSYPWMSVIAEQYFTVAPLFHISGRDKYENGKAKTLIKMEA
jgi:hypothetical protein